jgi:transposase-like protein
MSILSRPYFHDEKAAYAKVESIVWPNGPVCPHCGNADENRVYALNGQSHRIGLRKCAECRKQFTCKIGTIFESSHVPLHKWLQAIHLMVSSKKGISSNQLHRTLEVTLKTAWFMSHRIREAMRSGDLSPMGGNGGIVEVDETFIGNDRAKKMGRGYAHKHKVLSLVDRDTGKVRSVVVDDLKARTLVPILRENISKDALVVTDEAGQYKHLNRDFPHDFVRHGQGEYGRGEVHTNTIEGYFSIFKRGMKGVYQHCAKRHLHRYMAEFDFRYSNRLALGVDDQERAMTALLGVVGKRLLYRDSYAK